MDIIIARARACVYMYVNEIKPSIYDIIVFFCTFKFAKGSCVLRPTSSSWCVICNLDVFGAVIVITHVITTTFWKYWK